MRFLLYIVVGIAAIILAALLSGLLVIAIIGLIVGVIVWYTGKLVCYIVNNGDKHV